MSQAKVLTEKELKRALAVIATRRHADRDRLALLLTHWAGMRVCEVAALTRDKVIGPSGDISDEWRLSSEQTKGDKGRVVYANAKLKKEIDSYIRAHPAVSPKAPVLISQKGRQDLLVMMALLDQKARRVFRVRKARKAKQVNLRGLGATLLIGRQMSYRLTV